MTCVAYKDGQLACDTQISAGTAYAYHVEKLMRVDDLSCWISLAGTVSDFKDFLAWFLDHSPVDRKPVFKDDEGVSAIVLYDDGTVSVYEDTDYIAHPADKPIAIGSGAAAALGAMYAGSSASDAVAIASLIDQGTGGEVQSVMAGERPRRRRRAAKKRSPKKKSATVRK